MSTKIYTEVVIDMRTNEVLSEKAFDYEGDLALCGGGGGGKSMPKPEPAPAAPEPSKTPDSETARVRDEARNKAAKAAGLASTNKTGGSLTSDAPTQKKSLLGQ